MPMPGPMAARPYPSAPRRWMSIVWVAARTVDASIIAFPLRSVRRLAPRRAVELYLWWVVQLGPGSVPELQRVRNVSGDQRGEDERLQEADQDLEQEDEEHHEERPGGVQDPDRGAQHVPGGEHKDGQQQVPGEHVG